jgi:hypothetical protein
MNIIPTIKGIATFIPGLYKFLSKRRTGGTDSARYCYSVWLRHLVMAYKNGLCVPPRVVAELGPGDSIGIGLSALLSGCRQYFALDAVDYASKQINLEIFEELIDLFHRREPIPDNNEFPKVKPELGNYSFPQSILTKEHLSRALNNERLKLIKIAILEKGNQNDDSNFVKSIVPWNDQHAFKPETVDMFYSQAVMEHVNDVYAAYRSMYYWLKPGGFMSHQIDFKSHGLTKQWNGHWTYPDSIWKLVVGTRPYLLNRYPCSYHLEAVTRLGFEVAFEKRVRAATGVARKNLATKFRNFSDDDLTTTDIFLIAVKNKLN